MSEIPVFIIDENLVTKELTISGEFIVLKKGLPDDAFIQVIRMMFNPAIFFTRNKKDFFWDRKLNEKSIKVTKLKEGDKVVSVSNKLTQKQLDQVCPAARSTLINESSFRQCADLHISPFPEPKLIGTLKNGKRKEKKLI